MKKTLLILLAGSLAACVGNPVTPGAGADDGYRQFKRTCPYSEADCKREWRDKQGDENAARRLKAMRARDAERQAAQDEERERKKQASDAAFLVQQEADRKALKEARESVEKQRLDDEAHQKRACGKDYQVLRVGMSFVRYQQCWEDPAFVTETVVKGGVVETYRATFYWIHVQNDRIVSYTRRTR